MNLLSMLRQHGGLILACAGALMSAVTTPAMADRAELAANRLAYSWQTTTPGATHVVRSEGAHWLRLRFDAIDLPVGSVLRLTSLLDGARQHLNATTAAQWRNTSAYFNGPAVRIELLGAEGLASARVALAEVVAGRAVGGPESQCGATDDRVASSAENRARLLNIGCTANLTADGCFITAGHCMADSNLLDVVEFNVPLSTAGGGLIHPPPADQYVPTGNGQFSNGGIGNDWGVFTVFANTETGLTPLQAQGPGLEFSTVLPRRRNQVEITGYGVDTGSANQTQQVSSGPVQSVSSATNTLKYQADTEGGNSGSAVLVGGRIVAIHTNGGCRTNGRGANSGTMIGNAGFQAAYAAVCNAPVVR